MMKCLFDATRIEPEKAAAFRFAFKLAGDDESNVASKKKNKNKKKKKKSTEGITVDNTDNANADEIEIFTVDDDMKELSEGLADAKICGDDEPNRATADTNVDDAQAETVLSKSQKKNLQKKKAKKEVTTTSVPTAVTPENVAETNLAKTKPKSKKPKASSAAVSAATQSNELDEIDQILSSMQAEEASVSPSPSKASKASSKPTGKGKGVAAHLQTATGLAFAHLPAQPAAPTQRGPHFISSKDPELDEASKLRFKYGMGRNLVAIGPAKVRDPNWLPPPPGLTRNAPLRAMFSTGIGGEARNAVVASPVKSVLLNEKAPSGEEEHSSPFSFSFNGL